MNLGSSRGASFRSRASAPAPTQRAAPVPHRSSNEMVTRQGQGGGFMSNMAGQGRKN